MDSRAPGAVVPLIRRARGYRLYDHRGTRLLDLWRDGGGALLGHRAGASVTLMKSVLSQGLLTAVPSVWEGRLVRMIASISPLHRAVRLFSSPARALEAASRFLGMRVEQSGVHDPAIHDPPSCPPRAALWRPFLADALPADQGCIILPVLPLAVCGAPAAVCFPDEPEEDPGADHLPGVLLAGAFSALSILRRRGEPTFAVSVPVQEALDATRGWARRGPYVRATFPPQDYKRVFSEFLRAGVLLSPLYPGPSILPGDCSPGEARLLAELFKSIPGG